MDAAAKGADRGRRGTPGVGTTVRATDAQNNFGRVLDQATSEGTVYITRYGRPTAVVMSIDQYDALTSPDSADLDELAQQFEEMLARMQTPEAAAGVEALFEMDSAQLGEAAVRTALRGSQRDAG